MRHYITTAVDLVCTSSVPGLRSACSPFSVHFVVSVRARVSLLQVKCSQWSASQTPRRGAAFASSSWPRPFPSKQRFPSQCLLTWEEICFLARSTQLVQVATSDETSNTFFGEDNSLCTTNGKADSIIMFWQNYTSDAYAQECRREQDPQSFTSLRNPGVSMKRGSSEGRGLVNH